MSLNRRDFMLSASVGLGTTALARAQPLEELPVSSRELWEFARQQPVIEPGLIWLNTAFNGPSLRRVLIEEYRHREAHSANRGAYYDANLQGPVWQNFTTTIASFLGANPEELTFTNGCTGAIGLLASGLDLTEGDEILTTQHEHNAGIYPWLLQAKRRGVRVVQIALPSPLPHPQLVVDTVTAAITARTRVLAFSHVQYTDGSVLPVRELCDLARARNLLSVVDGAQAVGMLPVMLRDLGCDFYAANFHKCVNGAAGTGVLYLRDAARHRVWPGAVAGHDEWEALDRDGQASALPAAEYRAQWPGAMRKFDYEFQHTAPLFFAALPAVQFQRDIGPERIAARVRELSWYLRLQLQRVTGLRVLTSAHPQLWAGIVTFQVPGMSSSELARALLSEHRIAVRAVRHPLANFEGVRAATHIYNSFDDLDRLANAVARLTR